MYSKTGMSTSMAIFPNKTTKIAFCLFLLVGTLGHATSARILKKVDPQPILVDAPDVVAPTVASTLPSAQIPVAEEAPLPEPSTDLPAGAAPVVAPVAASSHDADIPDTVAPPAVADVAPVAIPVAASPSASSSVPAGAAVATEHPQLSFFMHDILGGSHPSGRVVMGIVANSDGNNLPFSEPNNQVFPINGGVPLNTVTGIINNNNAPFQVGLNGSPTNTIFQNNGNNNNVVSNSNSNSNLPFVSAGQHPTGLTLQQLMFGSITVVDNEISEGHELGSAPLGKALPLKLF